jgi:biopolymer transport protein ExbD
MAMSVGGDSTEEKPLSDINTTPLVDVMLVLLIIFLIAIPVALQTVPLKLPDVRFDPTEMKAENVNLSVTTDNGQCAVYWNKSRVKSGELLQLAVDGLKAEITRQGGPNAAGLILPEAHIRGDIATPYRCIGGTIFTMQQAGFARVGFISEPAPAGAARS